MGRQSLPKNRLYTTTADTTTTKSPTDTSKREKSGDMAVCARRETVHVGSSATDVMPGPSFFECALWTSPTFPFPFASVVKNTASRLR